MREEYKDAFEEFAEDMDSDIYASSAWDCTGLIPSLPLSESELEAYEDIYHFVQPALKDREEE